MRVQILSHRENRLIAGLSLVHCAACHAAPALAAIAAWLLAPEARALLGRRARD